MKKLLLFMTIMSMTLSQAQVSLVKDINPGSGDGVSSQFIEQNNVLIFNANDGINGLELWKSDGAINNTVLLKNIGPGNISSNPGLFYKDSNTELVYFSADDRGFNNSVNFEPWVTDGTSVNTFKIQEIYNGANSYPKYFTEFNGNVYFQARYADATVSAGYELIRVNGSSNSAFLIDVWTGNNGSFPEDLKVFNNKLYFSAATTSGRELWVTDGTQVGTSMLRDIYVGVNGSSPSNFTVFNNKLYFTAFNLFDGTELWVTDGTITGTQLVLDLNTGSGSSNPENLTVFNNALYFTATHSALGTEIFKMNTNENITNLKNIAPVSAASSNPSNLFVFNGKLYFSADDNTNGIELWSTTGFSSTTNMVKDINTSNATPDSNPTGFTAYNSKLYFSANDDTNGRELWVTDGTSAGTIIVNNINTSGDSNPTNLIVANNLLFFAADNGATGRELFKYKDPSLSVDDLELETTILLYPNPATDSFSIETNQIINRITVYDLQGKTVKSFKENKDLYNIEDLTSGMYFVKIKTDNGQITKKLIKK